MVAANSDINETVNGQGDRTTRDEMGPIDKDLMAHFESDGRIESGVPMQQRASDLDFIQMSGLTRPDVTVAAEQESAAAGASRAEGPEDPISFYERGVGDVDAEMAPGTIGDEDLAELSMVKSGQSTVDELQNIIADLGDGTPLTVDTLDEDEEAQVEFLPADILEDAEEDSEALPAVEPLPDDELDVATPVLLVEDNDVLEEDDSAALLSAGVVVPESAHSVGDETFPEPVSSTAGEVSGEPAQAEEHAAPVEEVPGEPELDVPELADAGDGVLADIADIDVVGLELPDAPAPETSEASLSVPDEHEAIVPEPIRSGLSDAELLLQELETQPEKPKPPPVETAPTAVADASVPSPVEAAPTAVAVASEAAFTDESETDSDSPRKRMTRLGRHKRRAARRLARLAIMLSLATLVSIVGYVGYPRARAAFYTPERQFARAQALAGGGSYAEASIAFDAFSAQNAGHPLASEAQFRSAFAVHMAVPKSDGDVRAAHQNVVGLFERFVNENPGHTKIYRAKTLMALLYTRLDQYEAAIALLNEIEAADADADTLLPTRRLLGRAHALRGDYEAARSAYLRAAATPGNYRAEIDYIELGDACQQMAEQALSEQRRIELQLRAIAHWEQALQVPGIDPPRSKEIEQRRDWLRAQIDSEAGNSAVEDAINVGITEEVPLLMEKVK